jgi:hypothetical protein
MQYYFSPFAALMKEFTPKSAIYKKETPMAGKM